MMMTTRSSISEKPRALARALKLVRKVRRTAWCRVIERELLLLNEVASTRRASRTAPRGCLSWRLPSPGISAMVLATCVQAAPSS